MNEITANAITTYFSNAIENFPGLSSITLNKDSFTYQLNGALRAGLMLSKEMNQFCSLLDNLFQNNTDDEIEKIIVYRAFNYNEMLRYINDDNFYTDLGYMSTSKEIECIKNFFDNPKPGYSPAILKITIPKNNILDLSDRDSSEKEILIRRCSLFKIISNEKVESRKYETLLGENFCKNFNTINKVNLKFEKYLIL